jgi:hypothetical protein
MHNRWTSSVPVTVRLVAEILTATMLFAESVCAVITLAYNSPELEIKVEELELVIKLMKEPSEEEGEGFATIVTFPSFPNNTLLIDFEMQIHRRKKSFIRFKTGHHTLINFRVTH